MRRYFSPARVDLLVHGTNRFDLRFFETTVDKLERIGEHNGVLNECFEMFSQVAIGELQVRSESLVEVVGSNCRQDMIDGSLEILGSTATRRHCGEGRSSKLRTDYLLETSHPLPTCPL